MNRNNKRGGRFKGGDGQGWRHRIVDLDNPDEDTRMGNTVEIKRRVTFKPQNEGAGGAFKGGNRNRGANKRGGGNFRAKMFAKIAEDLDMGDPENSGVEFRKFRNGRPGSPPPRFNRRLQSGPSDWYHVTIPHGQKYEKDIVMRLIAEQMQPDVFVPYYYKVESNQASFWCDDYKTALKLQECSRKASFPSGFKVIIICRPGVPTVNITEEMKAKMTNAMGRRFNASFNSLDLAKFHADEGLQDIFCGLFRPTIMKAVIEIIGKNIPNLLALNLSDNKLHFLDHLNEVPKKLSNLKILYLKNNRIQNLSSLDVFKACAITELDLTGNPAKEKYKDSGMYVHDVRKRFPKLLKLDGNELPKQIGFDLDEPKTLVSAKASFLVNASGADMVRQFLEQYYALYDSDNRQDRQRLLDAYHEHAQFSLSVSYGQHQSNAQRLTPYLPFNRNILRARDSETRARLLKSGRLPIVSLLSELPATRHDPQSFGVDLSLCTDKLMSLTITGMFKERKEGGSTETVRSFQKSLVIVPSGSGFCIRNEVLHINNATAQQEKAIFVTPSVLAPVVAAPVAAVVPNVVAMTQPPTATSTAVLNDQVKQNMVMAMCTQSGMNLEWSRKCLEETQWNYERAALVFTELHKQNKIPAQAFVK